jgi:RNA polymerase sigma factor, sigma-70 family
MFSYVSNTTFPKPLSIQEEQKYFMEYKNGSIEAKNILIERNLRLVAHIAKKYNNKDSEDLISIGTIGLIKAINTYKSDKGVRLATYAVRCIENEILMHIRSSKKYSNDVSLQDPIGIDQEGNEVSLEDKIFDDKENIDDKINLKFESRRVSEIMKSILQKREKLIIALRYGLINGCEKTQREIAELLGISRSYVSRIEKKALQKLNKKMNE